MWSRYAFRCSLQRTGEEISGLCLNTLRVRLPSDGAGCIIYALPRFLLHTACGTNALVQGGQPIRVGEQGNAHCAKHILSSLLRLGQCLKWQLVDLCERREA